MALKIRLRQQGRTNRTTYRLVVIDSRCMRDGKYVEAIGWYNPIEAEDDKNLFIKPDRIQYWLNLGAQLSDNAEALVRRAAPHVIAEWNEKQRKQREKQAEKRRNRSKKKQAAPKAA